MEKLNYSGELPKNEFDADVLIKSIRKPTENQLKKIITLSVFLLPYLLGANALASFNQNRVFSNFPKQEKVSIDPSGSFINIKYRVRRNDNLWEISKRFEKIKKRNFHNFTYTYSS